MTTKNPSKLALFFVKFLSEKEGQDIITNYEKRNIKRVYMKTPLMQSSILNKFCFLFISKGDATLIKAIRR